MILIILFKMHKSGIMMVTDGEIIIRQVLPNLMYFIQANEYR